MRSRARNGRASGRKPSAAIASSSASACSAKACFPDSHECRSAALSGGDAATFGVAEAPFGRRQVFVQTLQHDAAKAVLIFVPQRVSELRRGRTKPRPRPRRRLLRASPERPAFPRCCFVWLTCGHLVLPEGVTGILRCKRPARISDASIPLRLARFSGKRDRPGEA